MSNQSAAKESQDMVDFQTLESEVLAWRERFPQYEYRKRIDCIVRKVEIEKHENGQDWRSECASLLASGEKIQAIELCRASTGMDLQEAMDAVNHMNQGQHQAVFSATGGDDGAS
jgi:ribosomal protein L7/L12